MRPGWYQDNQNFELVRYWDGSSWTKSRRVNDNEFALPSHANAPQDAPMQRKQAKRTVAAMKKVRSAAGVCVSTEGRVRDRARKNYKKAKDEHVAQYLESLSLYALKEVGASGVRASALEEGGCVTIGDVLRRGTRGMQRIRGIGPHSATEALAAAERIQRMADQQLHVDFDDGFRSQETTRLLRDLWEIDFIENATRHIYEPAAEVNDELERIIAKSKPAGSWWRQLFASEAKKNEAKKFAAAGQSYLLSMEQSGLLAAIAETAAKIVSVRPPADDRLWADRLHRKAEFQRLLSQVGSFSSYPMLGLPTGSPPESGKGPRDGVTTVYRMYDIRNTLLYVGISNRVDMRMRQHAEDKHWFDEVDRIETVNYPDRRTALDVEKRAIISEKPRYNVIHNSRNRKRS